MKNKGLWLYGLSGSGKTFLSKKFSKTIKNSFIIDGDVVRKFISFNLGYKLADRIKQNYRVLGIARLVMKNGYYPIISTVYLDPKVFLKAKKCQIRFINVLAPPNRINKKLLNKRNVVGKSIKQPKINCETYQNYIAKKVKN